MTKNLKNVKVITHFSEAHLVKHIDAKLRTEIWQILSTFRGFLDINEAILHV